MSKEEAPCPAHGSYKDRDGVKRYYRSASRMFCLLESYDACRKCEHTEFELELIKADTLVECPVVAAAQCGPGATDDPVRNAEIDKLREGDGPPDALTTLNTCVSDMPFPVCPGCLTRRKWTKKPS